VLFAQPIELPVETAVALPANVLIGTGSSFEEIAKFFVQEGDHHA
jgi:hypothetical protein